MFTAWNAAVDHHHMPPAAYDSTFRTHIYCAQVCRVAQLRQFAWKLKRLLVVAKQTVLMNTMNDMEPDLPASEILRRLRPFTGPSNPKKHKHKPLPLIHNVHGSPCTLHSETVVTWVEFFQDMECGQRMPDHALRQTWIEELCHFQYDQIAVDLKDLPTLTDSEISLRRVPS